jgi:putative ABC transport system permease protein
MVRLFCRISIPELRRHLLRYFLTVLGIALGVAVFTAIRSANTSLKMSLRDTIDQIAGKAVLQITAGNTGLPEPVLDDVRSVSGIRAAVPIVEAVVHTTDTSQGNLLILGVDMAGDRSMRDYEMEGNEDVISDPLVFLAQPDSILISREFASRNDLREDSRVNLVTGAGNKVFTVRGIMTPKGMAKAFGGNVAVMDIYSAQFVFGRSQRFDRIDVTLNDGISIDDASSRIQSKLGPGYKVETPMRRGRQTESLMQAYTRVLLFTSLIALTIGLFLIFNVFAIAVTQRRTQIGILRAIGVTRAQIQRLFLLESVLLGIAGSIFGVLAGTLLGRGMMVFIATIVEETYGIRIYSDHLRFDPFWIFVSFMTGIIASLLGAFLPARAASRVDPAVALQKGRYQVLSLGENRIRRWIGFLLLLACMAIGFSPWSGTLYIQILLFGALFTSLALLVPTFSHVLAGLLRRPMGALFGMEGRLASDSLVQAPRRTSATVSALMFSLAFVMVMATYSVSIRASFSRWIDFSINPDLFVSASENITVRTFQLPPSVGEELKRIPGVRQVDFLRMLDIEYGGGMPLLESIEIDQWVRRCTPLMEEGRVKDLVPGMLDQNGLLVSNNFARIHGVGKGSRIFLDTPTGRHEFMIVGVQVDYSSDRGSILMDRKVYTRLWKDDRVDIFDLMLERGQDPERVRAEIQRHFAGSRNVFILTNKDMRSEISRLTDQFLSLQYVQLLVAVLVAVLGIVNSLMVSITERKREIGIVRGLGGERSQVRKAILLEAVCIGLVAVVLGIVCGTVLGYYSVETFGAAFNGWIFPYQFPLAMALGMLPGVLCISLLAAWYPANLALKTPLMEALAYE